MPIINTSTTLPAIVTLPPSKQSETKLLNAKNALILKMATYPSKSNADAIGLLAAGNLHPPRRRALRTFHGTRNLHLRLPLHALQSKNLCLSISSKMVLDGKEQ